MKIAKCHSMPLAAGNTRVIRTMARLLTFLPACHMLLLLPLLLLLLLLKIGPRLCYHHLPCHWQLSRAGLDFTLTLWESITLRKTFLMSNELTHIKYLSFFLSLLSVYRW